MRRGVKLSNGWILVQLRHPVRQPGQEGQDHEGGCVEQSVRQDCRPEDQKMEPPAQALAGRVLEFLVG